MQLCRGWALLATHVSASSSAEGPNWPNSYAPPVQVRSERSTLTGGGGGGGLLHLAAPVTKGSVYLLGDRVQHGQRQWRCGGRCSPGDKSWSGRAHRLCSVIGLALTMSLSCRPPKRAGSHNQDKLKQRQR